MTQEEIEGNRIIAEFMGELDLYHWGRDPFNEFRKAEYHTSLDWLKPAIDKFLSIDTSEFNYHATLMAEFRIEKLSLGGMRIHHSISEIFKAVVLAIKWYNQAIEQVKQTTPDRV